MTGSTWLKFGLGVALLTSACSADGDVVLGNASQQEGTNPYGVKSEDICFTAHNAGASVALTGTRFSLSAWPSLKPTDRVILLIHGAVETREIFDGGKAGVGVDGSFARELAKAGYIVVTVDRAGYGESPYSGPGGGLALSYA